MKNKVQITKLQMITFLIQTQIGVAFLSLPYEIHQIAKGDSWISLLLTGLFMEILVLFYLILCSRFPNQDLFQILHSMFGNAIGKGITFLYMGYFLFTGATILVLFVHILKRWMLPYTPAWVILFLMASVGIYIAIDNLKVIARFYFIATFALLVFLFITPVAFKDENIHYILPIGQSGLMNILKGASNVTLAWQGIEFILLISPFVLASGREKFKAATLANIFITFFYSFLTFVCLIYFNNEVMKLLPQPVLYLLKSFSFKIIERPDLFIISLWIILVGTSFISYLYGASLAGTFLIKRWPRKAWVYLSAFTCFVFALFFNGENEIEKVTKTATYSGYIFFMAIPVFLLLLSFLFKKRSKGEVNAEHY
ncbi:MULTISPECIES: GerAB/ArcD/ProY family transporter [Neobacillus]|uniref:GerAB/ArcD/ProY family transporter n=1 Tax=Neobacillus rhizophilus TaxID=2833579 RepID=A0A942UBJ9_9BACI|nr:MULTISPECIES: GerAB/ArcD/ProY family transporter [Neobacillus]MBS4216257.1 GerAB/ArcD/ProY family transporter [Neobacillus rhizophilus]